jgi:hypothetical protein
MLLDGPVYHSGTQMLVSNDEHHIKTQMQILERTPIRSSEDKQFILTKLSGLVDGYAATADSSMCQFVPELLELHPDAVVICTVRDPDAWAKSMGELASTSFQTALSILLFWVPCLRYFPRWVDLLHAGRWGELYTLPGEKPSFGRQTWERHMEYLDRCVPKERLVFYDVRDGWEPLCKVLDVPVPKCIEFPRINDGAAMDAFAQKQIQKGLIRWAIACSAALVAVGGSWRIFFK